MQKKYVDKLMKCKTLDELLSMFWGMPFAEKKSVLDAKMILPKGTVLYRARKDKGKPLFSKDDWGMPPKDHVNQGRFNHAHEPVLYVGTIDSVLTREIGLRAGDSYYMAEYECTENIVVGSLLKTNNVILSLLHKIAMSVESEDKLTEEEKKCLHAYDISPKCMLDFIDDHLSVLYISSFLHKDLYDYTNKISDFMLDFCPDGIRYNSCYVPFELSGSREIVTFDGPVLGNYALTSSGAPKLELKNIQRKQYTQEDYDNDMSMFISIYREDNGK